MITGINESKPLTKHISYECECKFVERKCNSNQWLDNDKCWCKLKLNVECCIWIPATCDFQNGKYFATIIEDSVITCCEIIDKEETKTVPTNFNVKSTTYKTQFMYFPCLFVSSHCIIDSC